MSTVTNKRSQVSGEKVSHSYEAAAVLNTVKQYELSNSQNYFQLFTKVWSSTHNTTHKLASTQERFDLFHTETLKATRRNSGCLLGGGGQEGGARWLKACSPSNYPVQPLSRHLSPSRHASPSQV